MKWVSLTLGDLLVRVIYREVLIKDLLLSSMLRWMYRVHKTELVFRVLLALPEVGLVDVFSGNRGWGYNGLQALALRCNLS